MKRRKKVAEAAVVFEDDPLWYKDAIIYEVHVRAFSDSNGDGIGDFNGLVQKLDYLQDLGITALWLLPFYPSPLKDDGYDIAENTQVHPNYGTLADFKSFLAEAHARGLRVITELVVNHTSDQHPWFQRARRARPGSREREFYVWSDSPDKYSDARIIFKDFESSNWTWDSVANAYYWHRFYSHQPDLNFDSSDVRKAVFRVLDFWLGMGIDGMRLDAVPYLYEREGTNCENLEETHAFLKELRRHVDQKFQNRMLLAEANQWPEDSVAYFGAGDECHMSFHFPVMPRLFMAIQMEDRFPVIDILQQTPAIPENSQWALFLRNHDELTLEMVTDEDRDYMYRVYGKDPQARINLGIRRRLAPLLGHQRSKIELMNGLLLSLPGTPVLYYGDEIGMGDNIYLGDRNGVRTPMQWSPDRNAGFSRANPQRLYLPVIIDPEYHFEAVNVEAEQNNPNSLLWWVKHLIALRKRHKSFGRGTLEFLYPDNHKVLAFVRRYEDECILVIANLSRFAQFVALNLDAFKGMTPVEMLGGTKFPPIGDVPYLLTLGSYAFYWFNLRRQQVAALSVPSEQLPAPVVEVSGEWAGVFRGKSREALEALLPAYLETRHWFARNPTQIKSTSISDIIPISCASGPAYITLVDVVYDEGDPSTYVLPLALAEGEQADRILTNQSFAILCRLRMKQKQADSAPVRTALIYDPLAEKEFGLALVDMIARRRRFPGSRGTLVAVPFQAYQGLRSSDGQIPEPTPLQTRQSNTSVTYANQLIMKVYRRLEDSVNPELAMGRFLTEKCAFKHVAPVAGYLEYQPTRGQPMTVGILHGLVTHEASAWQYTLDALSRYFDQVLARGNPDSELSSSPQQSLMEFVPGDIPPLANELIGPHLEIGRLIGQRTGEFHVALASSVQDPDFAPEPFTPLYQRSVYQAARTQARQTFDMLRARLPVQPPAVDEIARRVLAREEEIIRHLRRVLEHKVNGMRIRCHGDYHLGHLLYTGKDFIIIDLEGEADRTIASRKRKRSPFRDVTSMVYSFAYATLYPLANVRPEDSPILEPWARFWHRWVSVAFLKAYFEVAAPAKFLPDSHEKMKVVYKHYLLRRIIAQLRHHLINQSPHLDIPLRGLLHLLELDKDGPAGKPTPESTTVTTGDATK